VPAACLGLVERVVQRLAHEVVGEREAAVAERGHQARGHRLAKQPVDGRGRNRHRRREHLPVELPAEHGGVGQQAGHRLGQQREPAPHRVPHARRDRRERVAAVPQARGLLDEERVAAGTAVHLARQVVVRLDPGGAGDQRADLRAVEAGQRDRRGAGQQRQHQRGQRVVGGLDLDVAVGADEQQALEPRVLRDELQQPHRLRVRPVQVVEHHHDRLPLRRRDERAGDRVVDLEPVLGPVRTRLAEQDLEAADPVRVARLPA
jgi:hypothetical protein